MVNGKLSTLLVSRRILVSSPRSSRHHHPRPFNFPTAISTKWSWCVLFVFSSFLAAHATLASRQRCPGWYVEPKLTLLRSLIPLQHSLLPGVVIANPLSRLSKKLPGRSSPSPSALLPKWMLMLQSTRILLPGITSGRTQRSSSSPGVQTSVGH